MGTWNGSCTETKNVLLVLTLLDLQERVLLPGPFGMGQRKVHQCVFDLALNVFISFNSSLNVPSLAWLLA